MPERKILREFARKHKGKQWYAESRTAYVNEGSRQAAMVLRQYGVIEKLAAIVVLRSNPAHPLTGELLHALLKPEDSGRCMHCGRETVYSSQTRSFREYCSKACVANSELVALKKRETCNAKYGVDNPSQAECCKTKRSDTNLHRHGVSNAFQSKKLMRKAKKTILARYGVDNVSKAATIKKKKEDTYIKHFGKTHWTKADSMQHKLHPFDEERLAKAKATMLEKYGVENPFYLQRIQEELLIERLDKYSEVDISEMPSHRHKLITDRFGKVHCVQGYEDRVIKRLSSSKKLKLSSIHTVWREVPRFRYKFRGSTRNYFPDLRICTEGGEHIIEVKSLFTLTQHIDENLAKFRVASKSCARKGRTFWLFCYVGKRLVKVKNPRTAEDLAELLESRLK